MFAFASARAAERDGRREPAREFVLSSALERISVANFENVSGEGASTRARGTARQERGECGEDEARVEREEEEPPEGQGADEPGRRLACESAFLIIQKRRKSARTSRS